MPITGDIIFDTKDNSFVGITGYFNDIDLIISAPGENINDVILSGNEHTTYVNKVPVKAGYFYNEMYVFYFAEFKLGEFTVHLENCGLKSEREKIKLEFATAIYEIISLERIDLTGIKL